MVNIQELNTGTNIYRVVQSWTFTYSCESENGEIRYSIDTPRV